MNTVRVWTIGAVAAVVVILGVAFGLGVQPRLQSAAAADAQTAQVAAQNATVQADIARLSRAAAGQASLEAQDAKLQQAVPSSLKLNTFTRDLRNLAVLDDVSIESLAPSAGVAYAAPAEAAPPVAPAPAASPAPTASPAPSTAPAPVGPSGWFGKTDPAVTGANFTVIPVSVVVRGTASAVQQFASDVQKGDRLFTVQSFNANRTDGAVVANLTGAIYAVQR